VTSWTAAGPGRIRDPRRRSPRRGGDAGSADGSGRQRPETARGRAPVPLPVPVSQPAQSPSSPIVCSPARFPRRARVGRACAAPSMGPQALRPHSPFRTTGRIRVGGCKRAAEH
jgi:hypothetical protein